MRKRIGWMALMLASTGALAIPAMAREGDGQNRYNTYTSNGYYNGYSNNYGNRYGAGYEDGSRARRQDRWRAERERREHERREHRREYMRNDWRW